MKIRITLSMFAMVVLAITSCHNPPDEPAPSRTNQSDPSLTAQASQGDDVKPMWDTSPVPGICPSNFAIVAAISANNQGSSSVKGDVAVSPGNTVSGFQGSNTYVGNGNISLGLGSVQGTIYVGGTAANNAHSVAVGSYANLMAYTPEYTYTGTTQGDGLLLAPGTHRFENLELQEDGLLFLDFQGNPTAQVIIQVTGSLVTKAGCKVMVVNNNYQNCDGSTVFWAVGSANVDGLGFAGSIVATGNISIAPNVIVDGKLWSLNGSVSLNTDNVSFCLCQESGGGGGTTPPPPTPCDDFITGGGWIKRDVNSSGKKNDKATFGVAGGIKKGGPWGNLSYHDHANDVKVKSTSVTSYTYVDEVTRKIEGVAKIDGQGSYKYTVIVSDNGEPGRNDTFSLELSNGYKASGKLGGGNIQLHKGCKDKREKDKDKDKDKEG